MKKLRIYIDTSIIGGCLDKEFQDESRALFDMAQKGEITLLISDLLRAELERAPREVQEILSDLPDESLELAYSSKESERLRNLYLQSGFIPLI
ncbi:hypothetical protein JW926_15630 [Candidatus Sumerlaeota bacterium]|nr:hypothetical protein [Candidatus Sumerlaeota bacterium]